MMRFAFDISWQYNSISNEFFFYNHFNLPFSIISERLSSNTFSKMLSFKSAY